MYLLGEHKEPIGLGLNGCSHFVLGDAHIDRRDVSRSMVEATPDKIFILRGLIEMGRKRASEIVQVDIGEAEGGAYISPGLFRSGNGPMIPAATHEAIGAFRMRSDQCSRLRWNECGVALPVFRHGEMPATVHADVALAQAQRFGKPASRGEKNDEERGQLHRHHIKTGEQDADLLRGEQSLTALHGKSWNAGCRIMADVEASSDRPSEARFKDCQGFVGLLRRGRHCTMPRFYFSERRDRCPR